MDALERHLARLPRPVLATASTRGSPSLATRRLNELRRRPPRGLVLGGFGWVHDLAPEPRTPVATPPGDDGVPLFAAREPGGSIHAPSMAQAVGRGGAAQRLPRRSNGDGAGAVRDRPLLGARARRRSRCSTASARARRSARCSATASSAACTTGSSTASSPASGAMALLAAVYTRAGAGASRSRAGRTAPAQDPGAAGRAAGADGRARTRCARRAAGRPRRALRRAGARWRTASVARRARARRAACTTARHAVRPSSACHRDATQRRSSRPSWPRLDDARRRARRRAHRRGRLPAGARQPGARGGERRRDRARRDPAARAGVRRDAAAGHAGHAPAGRRCSARPPPSPSPARAPRAARPSRRSTRGSRRCSATCAASRYRAEFLDATGKVLLAAEPTARSTTLGLSHARRAVPQRRVAAGRAVRPRAAARVRRCWRGAPADDPGRRAAAARARARRRTCRRRAQPRRVPRARARVPARRSSPPARSTARGPRARFGATSRTRRT